jgi:GxxExxY protein
MNENEIGTAIIETAIEIHKELGPGLLETVYEVTLSHLLGEKGYSNTRQVPVPIEFRGIKFDERFRADLIVCGKVIVELKSKSKINRADRKQVQSHLRLTKLKLGYLLNFGEALLKDGIVRAVNGLEE